ncbi:hypothetical protein KGM_201430 [Danaus plexippus plexippus]|uniref:Uncharacterized protein n=1 Tax=Danaus plexippus plexippus TaxID=278856 RepID=A0A212EP85_DANPL|nr:hypothetical protein KGM_201430 [Danaus plexippus plexippus]
MHPHYSDPLQAERAGVIRVLFKSNAAVGSSSCVYASVGNFPLSRSCARAPSPAHADLWRKLPSLFSLRVCLKS